jgi:hypothetical protein
MNTVDTCKQCAYRHCHASRECKYDYGRHIVHWILLVSWDNARIHRATANDIDFNIRAARDADIIALVGKRKPASIDENCTSIRRSVISFYSMCPVILLPSSFRHKHHENALGD